MEERILNALAGSPGKSAKEVARELGEATPIIMELLLSLAAAGELKQRTVGREQVFSIPKKAVPTPREITTGSRVQRGAVAPLAVIEPEPTPAPVAAVAGPVLPEPTIQQLIDAGHLKSWRTCPTEPPKPTMYDRIGGTIELEIGDSPIRARFQSVEQLHRFLKELIENEQAGQVPAEGKV